MGLCVPDTCSSEDLKNLVNMGEYILGNPDVTHSVPTAFIKYILGNPGVTHSVPTAFIDECSGYGMGHTWVTQDRKVRPSSCFE